MRAPRVSAAPTSTGRDQPDDGVLVMSEADESVVLAAVYEQHPRGVAAPLR